MSRKEKKQNCIKCAIKITKSREKQKTKTGDRTREQIENSNKYHRY